MHLDPSARQFIRSRGHKINQYCKTAVSYENRWKVWLKGRRSAVSWFCKEYSSRVRLAKAPCIKLKKKKKEETELCFEQCICLNQKKRKKLKYGTEKEREKQNHARFISKSSNLYSPNSYIWGCKFGMRLARNRCLFLLCEWMKGWKSLRVEGKTSDGTYILYIFISTQRVRETNKESEGVTAKVLGCEGAGERERERER